MSYQDDLTTDSLEREARIPDVIWELGLSPSEFVVLAYILRNKRRNETFEISRGKIAERCNLSLRSVTTVIYVLQSLNIIKIISRRASGLPNLLIVENRDEWCAKIIEDVEL